MISRTLIEPDHLAFVDGILVRQEATRERYRMIAGSTEAVGRENLGFVLSLRFDLPVDRVLALLTVAPPDLREIRDILAWVDTVPRQNKPETVQ